MIKEFVKLSTFKSMKRYIFHLLSIQKQPLEASNFIKKRDSGTGVFQ